MCYSGLLRSTTGGLFGILNYFHYIVGMKKPIRAFLTGLRVELLGFAFLAFQSGFAQLTFDTLATAQQMAQAIVGAGYSVSNPKLNCPLGASATFTNVSSNIGLTGGILLTNGATYIANGPNKPFPTGQDDGAPGDFDLDSIIKATSAPPTPPNTYPNTYDACSLEFDLVPACDTLRITYVFGSMEYPTYIDREFNDVLAFFISGPGIAGLQNIALVPGTTLPVNIHNINGGFAANAPPIPPTNPQYYVDNTNGKTIHYTGFTTPLVAKAKVIPCEQYHLKLAIADVSDAIFDSGVFFQANSIDCSPIDYNDLASNLDAVKNCSNGNFTFCRTGDITKPYTVKYTTGGTAVGGIDYVALPDSIVIPANQQCAATTLVQIPNKNVTGTKTVTIIYQYGYCSRWDTITLKINDPLPIKAGPDISLCSGDSVAMGNLPLPNTTYSWQPANGLSNPTLSNPKISLSRNGNSDTVLTYVLMANNPQISACNLKDSLFVTVKALPKAQFAAKPSYCAGSAITFTDNSSAPTGKNITNWNWNFGNGLFNTLQNPTVSYTSGGTYTVVLNVTDDEGCKGDTSVKIQLWPSPVVIFSADTACSGDSVRFTNFSSVQNGAIVQSIWNFGDGSPLFSAFSPAHLYPLSASLYTVQLIVTSDKNCVNTTQQITNVYPKPTAAFTSSPVCIYNPALFANQSNGNTNLWDFGDGARSTVRNPSHLFTVPGIQQVRLITMTDYGCTDTLVKKVIVFDQPKVDFTSNDTAGCPPLCAQFIPKSLTATDTIQTWDWLLNTGDTGEGDTLRYCYQNGGRYSPSLIATSNHGCKDTLTKNFYIDIYPRPTPVFSLSTHQISIYQLAVRATDNSASEAIKWWWDFGDTQTDSVSKSVIHTYKDVSDYTIQLKVENKFGCFDSTSQRLSVETESDVYIPNSFTPNRDGLNEVFRPYSTGIFENASYEMTIYDRWGAYIMKTTDINNGWDGNSGSGICQEGIYVYQIFFNDKSSGMNLGTFRGFVALLK